MDPHCLDIVVVPGLVFGPLGERMGRGAGYYDRFLARTERALRVALVFDFQIVSDVPQKPLDQPVHWILSESRELKAPFALKWCAERKG